MLYVVSDTEREFEINGNIKISFVFSLTGNLTSYRMTRTMMVYFHSIEFISIYSFRIKAEESSELVYTVDFYMMKYIPVDQKSMKGCCCHLKSIIFFYGISSSLIESVRKILISSLWFGLFSHVYLFHKLTFSFYNLTHSVFYIRYFRFFKILCCLISDNTKPWLTLNVISGHEKSETSEYFKLSQTRSHDSKFEIISVNVNHLEKVKSIKHPEILNPEKMFLPIWNQQSTDFQNNLKSKRNSKMSKWRNLVGKSPFSISHWPWSTLKVNFRFFLESII